MVRSSRRIAINGVNYIAGKGELMRLLFGSDLFSHEGGGIKFLRNVAENVLFGTYVYVWLP